MEEQTISMEKHQVEIDQQNRFYVHIVTELKHQIADLADQKAFQVAHNMQKDEIIQALQTKIAELQSQLKD